MNQLSGTVKHIKSVDGITHIYIEVGNIIFSSLILSDEQEYQKDENVHLLFKETEVMIATKESIVSARNSFVSPISFIDMGEILAQVEFDFEGTKITSIITRGALYELKCNVGDEFRWFVKSNEVSIVKV